MIDDDDDDNDISMADLNSTEKIILTNHAQEALHNVNVSMSFDDLTQKNIVMILKHLNFLYIP